MTYTIENEKFSVSIDRQGRELCSMRSKKTGIEYVWQADPHVWARHAPVLFPIVGRLKDKRTQSAEKNITSPSTALAEIWNLPAPSRQIPRWHLR